MKSTIGCICIQLTVEPTPRTGLVRLCIGSFAVFLTPDQAQALAYALEMAQPADLMPSPDELAEALAR